MDFTLKHAARLRPRSHSQLLTSEPGKCLGSPVIRECSVQADEHEQHLLVHVATLELLIWNNKGTVPWLTK